MREAMMVEGRDGWTTVIIPHGTDSAQFTSDLIELGYDVPKGTQAYLGDDDPDVFASPQEFLNAVRTGQHRDRMHNPWDVFNAATEG